MQTRGELLEELLEKGLLTRKEVKIIEEYNEIRIGSRVIDFSEEKTLIEA